MLRKRTDAEIMTDENEPVNSIILNGLITDGSHDFFSQKSASYSKATVETTSDDDFNF